MTTTSVMKGRQVGVYCCLFWVYMTYYSYGGTDVAGVMQGDRSKKGMAAPFHTFGTISHDVWPHFSPGVTT